MPILSARRDTNTLIELVNQQYIQEGPLFLLTGVILGANGFLIAVIPYLLRIGQHIAANEKIKEDEIPPTVSELVSKWETVEARIFFGFELAAAFCILLSWYPFKLRFACCIPASGGCRITSCCGCRISWATLRQFSPPIGLILVACCPTVKLSKGIGPAEAVLVAVHCIAAMMMFVGFILCEAHALSIKLFYVTCDPYPKVTWAVCQARTIDPGTVPYRLRYITWNVSAFFFVSFLVIQVVMELDSNILFRVLSFCSEVFAGLAMLTNMGVIWYYSPERLWSRRGIVGDWSQATVQPISSAMNAPIPELAPSTRRQSGTQDDDAMSKEPSVEMAETTRGSYT